MQVLFTVNDCLLCTAIYRAKQPYPAGCPENTFAGVFYRSFRIGTFGCVDKEIRFKKNSVVNTVDRRIGMMMGNEPDYAFDIGGIIGNFSKEFSDKSSTFLFLIFTVCVSVFFSAQRTGNIVNNRGKFKRFKSCAVKPLFFPDCFRIRPDFKEMVNIVDIPFIKFNHFFNSQSNSHNLTS